MITEILNSVLISMAIIFIALLIFSALCDLTETFRAIDERIAKRISREEKK